MCSVRLQPVCPMRIRALFWGNTVARFQLCLRASKDSRVQKLFGNKAFQWTMGRAFLFLSEDLGLGVKALVTEAGMTG